MCYEKDFDPIFSIFFSHGVFAQTLVNQSTIDGAFQQPSQIYSYFKALTLPDGSYGLLYNYFATGGGQDNYFIVHIDSNGNNLAMLNYNSLHNSRDLGTNMCVKGNYLYVVGVTTDSLVSSSVLCITLKLNISTWDTVWTISESIDSPVTQSPFSVAVDDSDNVYVGASVQTPSDFKIALVKYDANGHRQWENSYDTIGLYTLPVAMAFSGKYINVTGFSFDGSGHSDFVTAGFDMHSGAFNGSKTTLNGTGAISHPVNISTDHAALSYVGGTSTVSGVKSVIKIVSYDTLFNQLWMSTWGDSNQTNIASAMNTDAFVGTGTKIYLTGTTVNSSGNHSMVTVRFSTDGTLDWARTFTASNPAYPTDGKDVTTDGNGNSFVTGTQYNGTDTDIITVAYDSSGSVLWSKKYNSGAGKNDVPYNIGINDDGSIFVTARSYGVDSMYTFLRYDQWKPTPCGDTICPTITYSFGNGTLSTAGIDTFIEFDIYAKQNEPSLAYYGGNIIFTYGKDVFGNSIVDSNHIVITRGTIISDTNYMYSLKDTIYKSDVLPPNGGEVLLSIAPQSSSGLYAIADTFQQLCHVKIKRINQGNVRIGFDQFFMQNESFFFNGEYNQQYNLVNIGIPLSPSTTCTPYTLNYKLGNKACTLNGTTPDGVSFDVQFKSSNVLPIEDLGFIVTYNSDVFYYVSNTEPGWWTNTYDNSCIYSSNIGNAIYSTSDDQSVTSSTNTGYIQMQANAIPPYDANDAPQIPLTQTSYYTYSTIVLKFQPGVTSSTGGNIQFDMTYATGGATVKNDYGCIQTDGSSTPQNFTTATANKTNEILSIDCWTDGIGSLSSGNGSVRVFPNPFSDQFQLQYTLSKSEDVSINIEDVLGRSVYSQRIGIEAPGSYSNTINLSSELPIGIYFLKIHTPDRVALLKISKK